MQVVRSSSGVRWYGRTRRTAMRMAACMAATRCTMPILSPMPLLSFTRVPCLLAIAWLLGPVWVTSNLPSLVAGLLIQGWGVLPSKMLPACACNLASLCLQSC